MSGYKNRVLTRHYPDLSEDGDDVHVVMRNPRTIPPEELQAASGISDEEARQIAAQATAGEIAEDEKDAAENAGRGYRLLAHLIIGWHAYDGTATGDDQPLLGLPATADLVAKLPGEILTDLMEQVSKANPQVAPAGQEAGTSSPS